MQFSDGSIRKHIVYTRTSALVLGLQTGATSADELNVKLTDGTIQRLHIKQFEGDGRDIEVSLTASRNGQELYTESTRPLPSQFGVNRSVERTTGRAR